MPIAHVLLTFTRTFAAPSRPELTPEEIEQFKTLGFIVKRGLIPKETLTPWVDKLWQTAHEREDHFAGALKRDDPCVL